MKWSWTIGWIAGIRVQMHWTFILLLLWVGGSELAQGGSAATAAAGVGFVLSLFACVVLHEAGHALMARRYDVVTESITLLPIGGIARMQRIPTIPAQEFWIAVAGPAVNVVIAILLGFVLWLVGWKGDVSGNLLSPQEFLAALMAANVFLVLFNLIPAFPMDGGRVLRAALATRMSYPDATNIAAAVGQMVAMVFAAVGIFAQPVNPILLLIALFVYVGAQSEAQMARLRSLIGETKIRDAMMTRFRALPPSTTLQQAVDELLAGSQQDFPIVDEIGFVGLLRREDLVNGLRNKGREALVSQAMSPLKTRARDTDSLQETIERMRRDGISALPIFNNGQLVGMLTMENVTELLMVRGALAHLAPSASPDGQPNQPVEKRGGETSIQP
jgi:Zn-dependent protease